jgi:outer membrane beta-barrel protein
MGILGRVSYLGVCLFVGVQSLGSQAQVAESQSSIEQFRVQSHYGPEEALLSPLFPREDKVELSAGAVYAPLSSLMTYYGYQGSMIYHINRRHAVEPVFYAYNRGKLTGFVRNEVAAKINATKQAELGVDVPRQIVAASYLFSPYHAKLHVSSTAVSHFDLYLGMGAGASRNESLQLNDSVGQKRWRPGVLLTAGIRMLFQPRFALRIEARDFVGGATNFGASNTQHSFQLGAALSVYFGSFPSF